MLGHVNFNSPESKANKSTEARPPHQLIDVRVSDEAQDQSLLYHTNLSTGNSETPGMTLRNTILAELLLQDPSRTAWQED